MREGCSFVYRISWISIGMSVIQFVPMITWKTFLPCWNIANLLTIMKLVFVNFCLGIFHQGWMNAWSECCRSLYHYSLCLLSMCRPKNFELVCQIVYFIKGWGLSMRLWLLTWRHCYSISVLGEKFWGCLLMNLELKILFSSEHVTITCMTNHFDSPDTVVITHFTLVNESATGTVVCRLVAE